MESLPALAPINAITPIPGLYISEYTSLSRPHPSPLPLTDIHSITIPNSPEALQKYGITHVLSLTNARYCPVFAKELGIEGLHVDVEDNPYEDLVGLLEGLCYWVDDTLARSREGVAGGGEGENDRDKGPHRVLVHCVQGQSRSGAVIVAYLMWRLGVGYEEALGMVKKERGVVGLNSGFVEQLRVWEGMDYSVYTANEEQQKDGDGLLKREYVEWKANRGVLLSREQQVKREVLMGKMADLVGRFGERRTGVKGVV